MDTATTAEQFLRRHTLQKLLQEEFRQSRTLPERFLSDLTAIVLDQVAQQRNEVGSAVIDQRDLDHAECGVLYGYLLGYRAAQQTA